ncbi:MAG: transcription termination/antitermination protein NusA [Eubacteriaceae bacterium]|nr:transcription termination/antitermination protein NusA [Eubacteriaceae bacterium]
MKKKTVSRDESLRSFIEALDEIERTKGIKKADVLDAVKAALVAAYKKDNRSNQNVSVDIDGTTGEIEMYAHRTVVDSPEDDITQISLEEAKGFKPDASVGDDIEFRLDPTEFGRVATQNAKQYILQQIKESERQIVYDTYSAKKDELVVGTVQRTDRNNIYVSLGRSEGIMNISNQIPGEQYYQGMRLRVYLSDVKRTNKGSQIYVSRSHPMLIKRLMEIDIPEIADGSVEIKAIAREAGSRTKVAVWSSNEDVDPIGACVGQKGVRIQGVLNEIGTERIDIIQYSDDPVVFISNAISPAQVFEVIIDEEEHVATVIVEESQLSLAIGKDGQNVRLAARLTGWKIDIKTPEQYAAIGESSSEDAVDGADETFAGAEDPAEEVLEADGTDAGGPNGKEENAD